MQVEQVALTFGGHKLPFHGKILEREREREREREGGRETESSELSRCTISL